MKGLWHTALAMGLGLAILAVGVSADAAAPPVIDPTKKLTVPAVFDKASPDTVEELRAQQEHVKKVVKRVTPAVVGVIVPEESGKGSSSGSGVIIDDEGHVLTAGHVSGKPGRDCHIVLPSGKLLKAKTLGQNKGIDSGLIKITDKGTFPHLPKGDSSKVKAGQWVVAIGHPGGFKPTRTPVVRLGRISLNRTNYLQSDCTLVGGDSGGPLFDLEGNVIGIHSRIGQPISENVHVPINSYNETWDDLKKGKSWGNGLVSLNLNDLFNSTNNDRPYLGVVFSKGGEDLKVEEVTKYTAADKAGIKVGDVILKIDNTRLSIRDDLFEFMEKKKPHDNVMVTIRRGESEVKLRVKLGKRLLDRNITDSFRDVVSSPNASTVQVFGDGKELALGTVVGADGWIVTKASEVLALKTKLSVKLSSFRTYPARLVGISEPFDIAMLKIDANDLKPIEWAESKNAEVGDWLAAPSLGGEPVAVGVVSVAARTPHNWEMPVPPPPSDSGYMGVQLSGNENAPPKIEYVEPKGAAQRAGLKVGDLVLSVKGENVTTVDGLITRVQKFKSGDIITLKVKRGGKEQDIEVTLGKRPAREETKGEIQNNMGSKLSGRRGGFPAIMQTDLVIPNTACGGPAVTLDGKAIGMIIARAGRTETYIIPSEKVQSLISDLKSGKLPPKDPEVALNIKDLEAALVKAKIAVEAKRKEIRKLKNEDAIDERKVKELEDALALLEKAQDEAQKKLDSARKDATKQ